MKGNYYLLLSILLAGFAGCSGDRNSDFSQNKCNADKSGDCPEGCYKEGGQCVNCPEGMATCSLDGLGRTAVGSCSTGYVKTNNYTCSACQVSNCAQCSKGNTQDCNTCAAGYETAPRDPDAPTSYSKCVAAADACSKDKRQIDMPTGESGPLDCGKAAVGNRGYIQDPRNSKCCVRYEIYTGSTETITCPTTLGYCKCELASGYDSCYLTCTKNQKCG